MWSTKIFKSFLYSNVRICPLRAFIHKCLKWQLFKYFKMINGSFSVVSIGETCILLESPFYAKLINFVPTLYMYNINRRGNAYKANVLLHLLSSLVTLKSICITAVILLQNKALATQNSLMLKSGFPKCIIALGFCKLGHIFHSS